MIDLRPIAHTTGKLILTFGAIMSLPMLIDAWHGNQNWQSFLETGTLCIVLGALTVVATRSDEPMEMTVQQAFILTASLWVVLPLVGSLPFMIGAPNVGFTDAYFEAMSGMTTTGTTTFPKLDDLPPGMHFWRAFLQWAGGLGIIVVAMIFLPVMKVGGMQFFRTEGFDTMGKVLPRAFDIASELTLVYLALTGACIVTYILLGMNGFDAVIHALATCSTGGFSNYDASFGTYPGPPMFAGMVFMILSALPFIRMVQLIRGMPEPLFHDVQVRAFLRWIGLIIAVIVIYRLLRSEAAQGENPLTIMLDTGFNVASVATGTGFGAGDVTIWGHFPFVLLIMVGLVGACTSSTACSIKIFRFLVLLRAIKAQVRRMHSPHRVFPLMLDGRVLERDVVSSVMAFFTVFILTFGLLIVGLALTGLHPRTALTGAWTAIANIGPVWGPEVSGNGAVDQFPTPAKWMMITGMYLGRLELMSALVLLLPSFWRQ